MENNCNICNRIFANKYTLIRHNDLFHKNKKLDKVDYESQEELSNDEIVSNSDKESLYSNDDKPRYRKRKRCKNESSNEEESESEDEEEGEVDVSKCDDDDEDEINISKKTVQLLENMVIAAEIETYALTKNQIKNVVIKKERLEYSDDESEEDSEEEMENDSDNFDDEELDENSLNFLRNMFSTANKGILNLNVKLLFSILDCITPQ